LNEKQKKRKKKKKSFINYFDNTYIYSPLKKNFIIQLN